MGNLYNYNFEIYFTNPVPSMSHKEKQKDTKTAAAKEVSKKDYDVIKEIVFVVTGDTVAIREVKTGIQDNDYIEIVSGLQEGETIVTGPYSAIARKLKGGSRIRVSDKKKGETNEKKSGTKRKSLNS